MDGWFKEYSKMIMEGAEDLNTAQERIDALDHGNDTDVYPTGEPHDLYRDLLIVNKLADTQRNKDLFNTIWYTFKDFSGHAQFSETAELVNKLVQLRVFEH